MSQTLPTHGVTNSFEIDFKRLSETNLELVKLQTVDTICRRAVELGIERLGIDRMAIFLIDHEKHILYGTYGTNPDGKVRAETDYQQGVGAAEKWTNDVLAEALRVKIWLDAPIFEYSIAVSQGWKAAAALWDGQQAIGYLVLDNLIQHRPPRPYEADLLSLYGSMIGHLIQLRRAEEALRAAETRRIAAEQLRATIRKEQELNEFKTRMLMRVSHEFRTPLAVLMSSIDMLERYHERLTETDRESRFRLMRDEIRQIGDMLDNIAQVSQDQSSPTNIKLEWVELDSFCAERVERILIAMRHSHIIAWTTEPKPLWGLLDVELLRLICSNLLTNAVKYSPPGSIITMSAHAEGSSLILRVSDRGVGISPLELKRIFTPFFRGSNVSGATGMGVGLTLVQQAVQLQGGTIQVESRVGEGTTFTVTLPRAAQITAPSG
jgi:signal transduction histidine kinase